MEPNTLQHLSTDMIDTLGFLGPTTGCLLIGFAIMQGVVRQSIAALIIPLFLGTAIFYTPSIIKGLTGNGVPNYSIDNTVAQVSHEQNTQSDIDQDRQTGSPMTSNEIATFSISSEDCNLLASVEMQQWPRLHPRVYRVHDGQQRLVETSSSSGEVILVTAKDFLKKGGCQKAANI